MTIEILYGDKFLTFDKELLEEFKIAYNKALKQSQDSFMFYDNEFVVGYAKYLIEYLDTIL